MAMKPRWVPDIDTQGFLAIAIIGLIGLIVAVLLLNPPKMDERTAGVLMTVIGVLIACLKDVYSFFFGSSKGSSEKDKAMQEMAGAGVGTGSGAARVDRAAVAAAAAAIAAPPAAAIAAPPVVAEVVPPVVEKVVADALAAKAAKDKLP